MRQFEALDCTLTKCLTLVAVMRSQSVIDTRESTLFKKYLMTASDQRIGQIAAAFTRHMSLIALRSEMRGYLGLPRLRRSDSLGNCGTLSNTPLSKRWLSPRSKTRGVRGDETFASLTAALSKGHSVVEDGSKLTFRNFAMGDTDMTLAVSPQSRADRSTCMDLLLRPQNLMTLPGNFHLRIPSPELWK